MAAVKSLAAPGTSQSAREREKGRLISMQHNVPGNVKIQKQYLNSEVRSTEGCEEVWTNSLPRDRSNTIQFSQSFSIDQSVSYRSPESVEMDEIMAAMVLTSLSCSSVIQSPPQRDPLPSGSVDMECGGGELSDSGSSGYWSWEHGSVSPAPSLSVTETDSSVDQMVDKGLHMELEPGAYDELDTRRCKISSRGAYRCLWPACGKMLTSRVGMKRHIRILHLGSSLEQFQQEEDFYYTEVSSEEEESMLSSSSPVFTSRSWSVCSSTHSQPNSEEAPPTSSVLSQSAPSSVWQIHTEHLYQAWAPAEVTISPGSPSSCVGPSAGPQSRPQITTSRSRSISVGEQWLQRNSVPTRSHTISASPSRGHCSIRKGRGEAKKCRKVYGVEHRDQWCTACRWKKACQRFPD